MARADIYRILKTLAKKSEPRISYTELAAQLADRPDPQSGLSAPLCELNCELKKFGLPPISALVVHRDQGRLGYPGRGYWNCAAAGPDPRGEMERLGKWLEQVKAVQQTDWPESLQGIN